MNFYPTFESNKYWQTQTLFPIVSQNDQIGRCLFASGNARRSIILWDLYEFDVRCFCHFTSLRRKMRRRPARQNERSHSKRNFGAGEKSVHGGGEDKRKNRHARKYFLSLYLKQSFRMRGPGLVIP